MRIYIALLEVTRLPRLYIEEGFRIARERIGGDPEQQQQTQIRREPRGYRPQGSLPDPAAEEIRHSLSDSAYSPTERMTDDPVKMN